MNATSPTRRPSSSTRISSVALRLAERVWDAWYGVPACRRLTHRYWRVKHWLADYAVISWWRLTGYQPNPEVQRGIRHMHEALELLGLRGRDDVVFFVPFGDDVDALIARHPDKVVIDPTDPGFRENFEIAMQIVAEREEGIA